MALSIHNALLAICVYQFLAYWGAWRTRNLPRAEGGYYHNVFNDARHFCCIFGAEPCPLNIVCVLPLPLSGRGLAVRPSDLGSPMTPLMEWAFLTTTFFWSVKHVRVAFVVVVALLAARYVST